MNKMDKKMKISGVYSITNNVTGDFYIGSSKDIKQRWYIHRSPSAQKRLPNSKLYKAMAQYGRDNFTIEVIEETNNLREREQYWIEQLKPSYNNYRAKGCDIERYKETRLLAQKTYHKNHRDKELARAKAYYETHRDEKLAKSKAYNEAHRNERLAKMKDYYSRLCLYKGETLTLHALRARFIRQGIPHATIEAKEYLIQKEETNENI